MASDLNQYAAALAGENDLGQMTLFAPLAAPGPMTATTSGAGPLNGTYTWALTFETGYEQQTLGATANTLGTPIIYTTGTTGVGTPSAALSVVSGAVVLTGLPIGPTGVVERILGRTVANVSGTFYTVAVLDNTTTTFVDTVADSALGAALPTVNTTGTDLAVNKNLTVGGLTSLNNAVTVNAPLTAETLTVGGAANVSGALTVGGVATFPGAAGLVIESFYTDPAAWINLPTTGPSGIGTGGAGSNPFLAYVYKPGNWFGDSVAGDVAYRNEAGRLLWGLNGADAAMRLALANSTTPLLTLNLAGYPGAEQALVLAGTHFAVSSGGGLTTAYNTLDDGAGNASISGQLTAAGIVNTGTWGGTLIPTAQLAGPLVTGVTAGTGLVGTTSGSTVSLAVNEGAALTWSATETFDAGVVIKGLASTGRAFDWTPMSANSPYWISSGSMIWPTAAAGTTFRIIDNAAAVPLMVYVDGTAVVQTLHTTLDNGAGQLTALEVQATGTGTDSRFVGGGGIPTTGTYAVGDFVVDGSTGVIAVCTAAGTPGTWTTVGGASEATTSTYGTVEVTTTPAVAYSTGDPRMNILTNPLLYAGLF